MAKRKHGTLTADTVATVTLDSAAYQEVAVLDRTGSQPIYFTTDGSTPTVGGDDTFVAPAGGSTIVSIDQVGPVTVKLISAGAEAYSVMGV